MSSRAASDTSRAVARVCVRTAAACEPRVGLREPRLDPCRRCAADRALRAAAGAPGTPAAGAPGRRVRRAADPSSSSATCRPRRARRPANPAIAGLASSRCSACRPTCTRRCAAADARSASRSMRADELVFRRHDDLGRRRRRGRPQVGNQVRQRDVHLVADGRDDRHRAGRDRPRHGLLVEGPQVFNRAAAAPDDDDVDAFDAPDVAERPRDVGRRGVALDARRRDDHVRVLVAPAEHLEDVPDRGAVDRRDDADLAGQRGQRPLARRVEEALGLQALLQLVERQLPGAEALGLDVRADDLVLALRLVDAEPAAREDVLPVFELELERARGTP